MSPSPSSGASPSPSIVPGRDLGLDVARVLAVALVVIYHAFAGQTTALGALGGSGWMGVDLFFVLSGFLVVEGFQRLSEAKTEAGVGLAATATAFYRKRLKRVFPAYAVTVVLVTLMTAPRPALRANALLHLPYYFTFTANHQAIYAQVLWSISVEMQFYLLLPLAWVGRKGGRLIDLVRAWPWSALALAILLPACWRTVLYLQHPGLQSFSPQVFTPGVSPNHLNAEYGIRVYAGSLGHLDGLLLGAWLGFIGRAQGSWAVGSTATRHRLLTIVGVSGLLATYAVLAPWRTWMPRPFLLGVFGFTAVGISCLLLVLGLRAWPSAVAAPGLLRRMIEWVSDRIYSLYLSQALVTILFEMGFQWSGLTLGLGAVAGVAYIGAVLLVGQFLYDAVESRWSAVSVTKGR